MNGTGEAKKTEVTLGASGKHSWFYIELALMNALLGTRFKILASYRDSRLLNGAMEHGEVHGRVQHWESLIREHPEWARENKVIPLIQSGPAPHPDLRGTPRFIDLVSTEEERQMVELIHTTATLGHSVYAPPGVPTDRAAALRKSVTELMRDSTFVDDMQANRQAVYPASAEELERFIMELSEIPEAVVEKLRKAIGLVR